MIQTVADFPGDTTSLSLIYSNRSPFDIILDEDLTDFEKQGKLFYFPVVQAPDENWQHGEGHVTQKMIEALMPPLDCPESGVIVCGPDKLKAKVGELLKSMDYHNYYLFN
jgi:NAD(P)H-flavin reductase